MITSPATPVLPDKFTLSAQKIISMEGMRMQAVEIFLQPVKEGTESISTTREVFAHANRRKETARFDLFALNNLCLKANSLDSKKLFINISPYSLCSREHLKLIVEPLSGLAEGGFEIAIEINNPPSELTGSEYISLYSNAMKLVRHGFHFATNPFYPAVDVSAHLNHKYTPYLKIARQLLVTARESDAARKKLERDILIAQAQQRIIIGEGVENGDDWSFYLALGCDWAQGYFVAHPEPLTDEGILLSEFEPA